MKYTLRSLMAVLALASLAAVAPLTVQAAVEGQFERTLKVSGPVDLEVTTGSGNITVRPGDAGSVRVKGTIRATDSWLGLGQTAEEKVRTLEASPPIEQTGNTIRIGRVADRELRRNVSISYEVVVPVETRLRADTGSGDHSIEGIRGPVNADTGSGNVRMSNIGGEVRADTGSGDIELNSIQGSVYADTGSGSVRATGIAGGFVADTGSGDVTVQLTAAGAVKIETGSGDVEASGVRGSLEVDTGSGDIAVEGEPTGRWMLDAGSGNVSLRLPPQASAELSLHSDSGRIHLSHPVTVQGTIGRSQVQGKLGSGGVRVEAHTGSGDIRLD